jgi:hypothetical protein
MVRQMKHPELVAVPVLVLVPALEQLAVMQVLVECAGQWFGLWPGPAQRK